MLFFDEATSALDTHTEQALLQNINSILKEKRRTSVFVAHRLRTIYDSDLIIVLRDGQVAESGTHEQLVDRGGLYSELWSGTFTLVIQQTTILTLSFSPGDALHGGDQQIAIRRNHNVMQIKTSWSRQNSFRYDINSSGQSLAGYM